MKHMNSRRILAMLLALCMMVGMLSMTAFADEGTETSGESSGEAYVTVTGSDEHYSTLTEAVNAASVDADRTVTYTIYGKVNAGSTVTWIPILKSGLENVSTVKFVAGNEGAELLIENKTSILAVDTNNYDVDVSFENLKLSHTPNEQTIGDIGHGVYYFTCWLRNANASENTVTYTNCEFPNGACNNQYGRTVYNSCTFSNDKKGLYNLWNYGGNTTINGSTFNGTRGIKVYSETGADKWDKTSMLGNVSIENTSFAVTEKAAVVISTVATVSMDQVTVDESTTKGLVQKSFDSKFPNVQDKYTIGVTGSSIGGTFTTQNADDKGAEECNITAGTFKPTDATKPLSEVLSGYLAENLSVDESGTVTGGSSETAVAIVGGTSYEKLEEAFAALNETNHTLTLTDAGKEKWSSATPVYWAVGEGNYTAAATMTEALKAAYMENSTDENITVVCRPNASVGKMSHAHVSDNLVIYGNSAYVEIDGDQNIEVDTYAYRRSTGERVADNEATNEDYLDKDITINLYEIDNLSVWGQRHTDHTVTINMTDCETKLGGAAKGLHRIYISGINGVNNISLKKCKFASVPTAIYTNANGSVSVDSCEFNNAALAVNLNHKAAGTQNVDIKNCTFTGCGNADEWKAFAAPVRFVQSVEGGTQTATVDSCSFSETAGNNGDILLGDGRTSEESHDVSLTVKNTEANVMAQKPGYYDTVGNTVPALGNTKNVKSNEEITTSVEKLLPTAAEGVAKITHNGTDVGTYATLAEAFAAAVDGDTITLLSDCSGDGIVVGNDENKNPRFGTAGLIVDFGTHTYTVGGVLVGSPSTGTNAFQLLKGNKVTFKNGSIVGVAENTKPAEGTLNWHGAPAIVIQNYCDLKLDGMTITGGDQTVYTMSNNCGNITINNTTINAGRAEGYTSPAFAFDVYGGWYKDDVTVTVTGNSVINGDIEIDRDTGDSKNTLKLEGGTVTGNLKIGDGAVNNVKATVTKTNDVALKAPAGHTWDDNGKLKLDAAYVARIGDAYYLTLTKALSNAVDGNTITLIDDCRGDGLMVAADRFAGSGLTINFNNHIYTFNGTPVGSTGSETQAAHFESGNKITLKNGKFVAAAGQTNLKILVQNYCDTLTLDNMTLDGTNVFKPYEDLLTLSNNNGMVTIKDTTIIAPERVQGASSNKYAFDICGFQEYTGVTVTVTGSADNTSTINGNIKLSTNDKKHDLVLTLDKGTVNGKLVSIDGAVEKVKISKKADFNVGAPAGYKWNETGTELVKDETADDYVASVSGKKYQSLEEAIAAVGKGGTVYLNKDIQTSGITISDKEAFTLYLGSHTITGANAGTIALKVSNATVTLKADTSAKTVGGINGGSGGSNVAVCALTGANITIMNGIYTVGADDKGEGNSTIYASGGAVTIKGGTFSTAAAWQGKYYVLNVNNQTKGTITVRGSGAKFENFNPLNGDDNLGGNFCYNTYGVTMSKDANGNKIYTSGSGTYIVLDKDGEPKALYATAQVEKMLDDVQDGETVMLLSNPITNITIPAGKDFTLDLNGKTLSNGKVLTNGTVKENAKDHTITVEAGAKLTIVDNVGGGTVDNITHGKAAIVNKGEVVLNGGTYTRSLENADNNKEDSKGNSYYTIANYGTMTINEGVTVTNVGHYSSMIRNGGDEKDGVTSECKLTINGGTFDGGINTVKNDVMGVLTIHGGSFSNTTQFVVMNWNKTEITDGTFAPTAEAAAILFSACIDKDCAVGKLTISGGTFTAQANKKLIEENYYNKDGSIAYTGTAAVSGGTFNKPVDQKFCADGYEPEQISDTVFGVKKAEGNAQLVRNGATVKYANLDVLLDEALSGDTIQLRENVTLEVGFMLEDGVCLDLNGKVLTVPYIFIAPNSTACLYDSYEITSGAGVGMLRMATKKATLSCNPSGATRFVLPVYVGTEDVSGKTYYCYRFYRAMLSYPSSSRGVTGDADSVMMEFILRFQKTEAYQYIYNEPAQLKIRLDATYFVDETSSKGLYFEFSESYSQQWAARYKDGKPQSEFTFWVKITGLSAFTGSTVYGTPSAMSNYLIASIQGTQLEYQIP